jgi:methylated-DNA-[protein]-cysteine S-methyltransferase
MNTFATQVYGLVTLVPEGSVTTYKDIAHALGTGAYRAVGGAMRRSPGMPQVPCHRVVASDGKVGGFSGEKDGEPILRKIALLKREGVHVRDNRVVDFERKRYTF